MMGKEEGGMQKEEIFREKTAHCMSKSLIRLFKPEQGEGA
jgi:hypothetical protein